jgi:DNA-binding CsgD family transcriptional regulator
VAREGVPLNQLSLEDGALLDSQSFSVAHANGVARGCDALAAIRKAATQRDRARRRLRKGDVDEALNLWEEVIRGRWSMVDWFDTDGRRFILALPNAQHGHDPRGLTEREYQVAAQASTGDSCKLIAYRLGISRSRVSALLHRVMLKLGVQTRAELMLEIRAWLADPASNL